MRGCSRAELSDATSFRTGADDVACHSSPDANMIRFIHFACVIGLLVVIAITGNPYAWMHEIDPSVAIGAIKDEAGDRRLVAYALLMIVAVTQVVLLARSGAVGRRPWVSFLILAATGVCAWRASL
ncbi:hypothetical protein WI38_11450 [Burkholderia ubonensis]|uniref:DUF2269 family protein n=2 Tax=Burkholderia ubonensis TaxID=101571 RepID=A0A102JTD1_9BURK|nr:hypothetical protein WI35_29900 [Burkholderia ubonensis]KUZ90024.1 hypothetical protein WI39_19795 [Burkholderia ubonensis]KUZ92213.1 hypothetical protein WI38_11450 [Burkholderia ubonensis]